MIRTLHHIQILPITIEKAWDFFSRPENLNDITPDELHFEIKSDLPEKIYSGLIINYKVTPFAGIKVKWITEILDVNEPNFFTDIQRKGPYKLWKHTHQFKSLGEKTQMTDIVEYELPFGWIGDLFHDSIISPKLSRIFQFRKEILENKFGK